MRHLDSYLAGIFDGEGCVTAQMYNPEAARGKRGQTRLQVIVGMQSKRPVEMFHQRFGGSLKKYGKMWQWYIIGSKAREALAVFAELCVNKAPQARLALEMAESLASTPSVNGRRAEQSHIIPEAHMHRRKELVAALKVAKVASYADA